MITETLSEKRRRAQERACVARRANTARRRLDEALALMAKERAEATEEQRERMSELLRSA